MKHTTKQSEKARKNLITHYNYKTVDFYQEDEIWYLNTKDEVGLSAWDVYKNKMLELKEQYADSK